jgi:hypothetical protein
LDTPSVIVFLSPSISTSIASPKDAVTVAEEPSSPVRTTSTPKFSLMTILSTGTIQKSMNLLYFSNVMLEVEIERNMPRVKINPIQHISLKSISLQNVSLPYMYIWTRPFSSVNYFCISGIIVKVV